MSKGALQAAAPCDAQSKAAKRLEVRGHAQRASAAPEHRAAEGEGRTKATASGGNRPK